MKIKIAIITDIHAAEDLQLPLRSDIVEILLSKAIHRLNRWIKPDVVLFPGDITHDLTRPAAQRLLPRLKQTIDLLECPSIIIPGNHDCDRELFYEFFARPAEFTDIKGFRFICFDDPELPEYNAERTSRDIERMKTARTGHAGPIIALQHTSLFPPGATDCPFNLTNAEEIISVMKDCGMPLSISGHYHKGFDLVRSEQTSFVAAAALCEEPFSFLEIQIDGSEIDVTKYQLKMPEHLRLIDCHIHTPLAYCNENMDIEKSVTLAQALGLEAILFTEHTGQLYFSAEDFWTGRCYEKDLAFAEAKYDRMAEYFNALDSADIRPQCVGLEADCDYDGNLLIKSDDADKARFLMGAIHRLKEFEKENPSYDRICDELLRRTQKMVDNGIKVLAHPFRMFHRKKLPIKESLCEALVKMLRRSSVAAEINFHTQQTTELFIRTCLEAGVKLTLAGDAHELYEVGELVPHLKLLADCGYNGDLKDILLDPRSTD